MKPDAPKAFRRDGWTAARQLSFLAELGRTHCIAGAARAAGMSRASAYRLRARDPGGLFAALWDMALAPPPIAEVHSPTSSDGMLMRLLGNQYRRETAEYWSALTEGADAGCRIGRDVCDLRQAPRSRARPPYSAISPSSPPSQ